MGLHARPASEFVRIANAYKSSINVSCRDRVGIASSIISVLSLAVSKGDIIEISADGEDEAEAVEYLCNMVADGFGEL